MEYSVYDLIRILLKKWYVILITVLLFAGISTVTAKKSYENAIRNYEKYTSEYKAPESDGDLNAVCQYNYELTDFSSYVEEAKRQRDFYRAFQEELAPGSSGDLFNVTAYIESAYQSVKGKAAELLTDPLVLQRVQAEISKAAPEGDEIPSVGEVLQVDVLGADQFRVTVKGMEERTADSILDTYLRAMKEIGASTYSLAVQAEVSEEEYIPVPSTLTDRAQLAQEIMERPTAAPILAKTVGVSAVMAFGLACFGVLLYTLIRDTAPAEKRRGSKETA